MSTAPEGGYGIGPAGLRGHAAAVDGLAGRMRTAAAAATELDRTAYGVVGQVFAGLVVDTVRTCSGVVGGFADDLAVRGSSLRADQDGYDRVESDLHAAFHRLDERAPDWAPGAPRDLYSGRGR